MATFYEWYSFISKFHKLIDHMHKQHEREDFVHTEGPSYKSHFIVHDEDYER